MRQDQPSESDFRPELSENLKSFVSQLSQFQAKSLVSERDQLMFEAGRNAARAEFLSSSKSVSRTVRVWQTAALVLFGVSAGLGTVIGLRPEPQVQTIVVDHNERVNHRDETNNRNVVVPPKVEGNSNLVESDRIIQCPVDQKVELADSTSRIGEGLRERRSLIDDAFASVNGNNCRSSFDGVSPAYKEMGPREPEWNARMLLHGEKFQEFINHLTEESSL